MALALTKSVWDPFLAAREYVKFTALPDDEADGLMQLFDDSFEQDLVAQDTSQHIERGLQEDLERGLGVGVRLRLRP